MSGCISNAVSTSTHLRNQHQQKPFLPQDFPNRAASTEVIDLLLRANECDDRKIIPLKQRLELCSDRHVGASCLGTGLWPCLHRCRVSRHHHLSAQCTSRRRLAPHPEQRSFRISIKYARPAAPFATPCPASPSNRRLSRSPPRSQPRRHLDERLPSDSELPHLQVTLYKPRRRPESPPAGRYCRIQRLPACQCCSSRRSIPLRLGRELVSNNKTGI